MFSIIIFLMVYLICGINPAIILSKKVIGTDIRKVGSGNAGTTNAIRTMGKGWGALVFILDILKVIVSYSLMFVVASVFGESVGVGTKSIFQVATILGHCYPVYYGFKGGKGVAAFLVAALLIAPKIAIVCIVVGVIVILVGKMVSLGSVCGVILFDIMILVMNTGYILATIIASAVIIYKHRANIRRIINKEENKLF